MSTDPGKSCTGDNEKDGDTFFAIAHARPDDSEEIVDYLNTIGGETDNLSFGAGAFHMNAAEETRMLEQLRDRRSGFILVARHKQTGEIISVSGCISKGGRSRHVFVVSITVRRAYWRLGVGRAVLRRMGQDAVGFGAEKLSLRVNVDNDAAIGLYLDQGFRHEGKLREEVEVHGRRLDQIAMGKMLP